jgi:hypothetical protein
MERIETSNVPPPRSKINQVAMNPENSIFDAKRLIGRNYSDQTVQSDMKHWPFTVVNHGGKPKLQAEYKGERKTVTFCPRYASAVSFILTKTIELISSGVNVFLSPLYSACNFGLPQRIVSLTLKD